MLLLLSAFLLFSIQPMVAKMLLPILGGSPNVWNTAMVFYQAALLGGYLYSHLISKKLSYKAQLILHAVVLALPALVLPLYYGDLHLPKSTNPMLWMLLTMTLSVGLPFFVLSATSPLIQSWFSRAGHKDPYFLYAASNLGSFLGLLSYPFLIEPRLTAGQQSALWTAGYALLVVVFVATALMLRQKISSRPAEEIAEQTESLTWKRRLKWVFLAFVPSSQFIGVTTYLTTDIAVMPLLWVIPLAIYLLTMVLVFAKRPPIPHRLVIALFPYALVLVVFASVVKVSYTSSPFFLIANSNALIFGIHLFALFISAMLCHGELAKDRPAPGRLTEFFLWMSFGGVLGGVFNALVAPTIFVQVIEYTIILCLVGLALPARVKGWKWPQVASDLAALVVIGGGICGLILLFDGYAMMSAQTYRPLLLLTGCLACLICVARPLRFAMAITGVLLVGAYVNQSKRQVLFTERSFFGVQRVEAQGSAHLLFNGRVLHGKQILTPELETVPLTYYHPRGPLKEVFEARPPDATVGVVGLGIGSAALYSRKGENWTYYEIDPLVEKVARDRNLFTCLAKAQAPQAVVIGDARLSLAGEPDGKFDILLMDAFSSDSVPAHLLTMEAFELYRSKLKPGGLLAVHITNRYLDLQPLVAAICARLQLRMLYCSETAENTEHLQTGRELSTWCVVAPETYDWARFTAQSRWTPGSTQTGIEAWTDQFSSIMPLLK
ncbi:MAG TPA: fused MFS/spermidine synthase [Fimbriimonas sp.]|nr:fused MFS/spermidine synthase [Fimbriimonas sp.]